MLFSEFRALGEEPWLVVRKKIYIIEEFFKKWHTNLEGIEPNELISRITQEILNYEVILFYFLNLMQQK